MYRFNFIIFYSRKYLQHTVYNKGIVSLNVCMRASHCIQVLGTGAGWLTSQGPLALWSSGSTGTRKLSEPGPKCKVLCPPLHSAGGKCALDAKDEKINMKSDFLEGGYIFGKTGTINK